MRHSHGERSCHQRGHSEQRQQFVGVQHSAVCHEEWLSGDDDSGDRGGASPHPSDKEQRKKASQRRRDDGHHDLRDVQPGRAGEKRRIIICRP